MLHPTSLPGPFGIGDLGAEAYRFADFLSNTGQSVWQILPLCPPSRGNSPYMSFSAFAGNPLLISLEKLVEEGLLAAQDIAAPPPFPADRVDYPRVRDFKMPLLRKAFGKFIEAYPRAHPEDFYRFTTENNFWLEDYALFMALRDAHGGRVWTEWEEGAVRRDPGMLAKWRNVLAWQIQFHRFTQYTFFKQWHALKDYCHKKGIRLFGDIPIYVDHNSADVWAHQELFILDESGNPVVVSGVPPDYFSATGQLWANPIYRWDVRQQAGFSWWIDRFRINLALVDMVRLDHFRGFEAYWEIPAGETTAVNGRWVKGPGVAFFEAVEAALGKINIVVEDLGVITPEVDALRDHFGYPGMRVLQMAFGTDPKAPEYRPHNHIRNCVVYTGTHDNDTTIGWFTTKPGVQTTQTREEVEAERRYVLDYVGHDGREINWDMVRLAFSSVAGLAMVPLQDLLGLGSEARMNFPAKENGNWEWRFRAGMLTPAIQDRLKNLTRIYERCP